MNPERTGNGHTPNGNGAVHGCCPFSTLSKTVLSEKLRTAVTPTMVASSINASAQSTDPKIECTNSTNSRPLLCPGTVRLNTSDIGNNCSTISVSSFDESDLLPTPSPMGENSSTAAGQLNSKVDLRILSAALMKFLYPKSNSIYKEIGENVSRRSSQTWESARRNFSVLKQQKSNDENRPPTNTLSDTLQENGHSPTEKFDHDYEAFLLLERFAKYLGKKLELDWEELIVECGEQYGEKCLEHDAKALKFVGDNLIEFLVNVENIQSIVYRETAIMNSGIQQYWPPAQSELLPVTVFVNHSETNAVITYNVRAPICRFVACFLSGMLRKLARVLYNIVIKISVDIGTDQYKIFITNRRSGETLIKSDDFVSRYKRLLTLNNNYNNNNHDDYSSASGHRQQLLMSVHTFGRIFPFHFVCDQNLRFIQYGTGLKKVFARDKVGQHISSAFSIREPNVGFFFESIRHRTNLAFIFRVRDFATTEAFLGLEVKGQIIECVESKCLLFLGSPIIKGLQSLTSRGLFLSDIPIHDATRDIILVEEQSRAQESLKRRMDKLKENIQKASKAVEIERSKNVDLLNLIFPARVARQLWLGQPVKASQYDDVTMLFSDIVGFTSICSTASPMAIINMLNELYTQFDGFCGEIDVYKTETIGDAYCVASGIHRQTKYHATKAAFMALKMIGAVKSFRPKDLNVDKIEMRIGLHSGTCLSGIVGVKMPRYCLFGANVTLANKFESHSEPLRVNISPVTFRLLCEYPGFVFTKRSASTLPKDVPADMEKVCYFIDEFRHPDVCSGTQNEHIAHALDEIDRWEKNFT